MIAQLQGKLIQKDPGTLIIDCGGVGYEVRISLSTYTQVPDAETVKVFTHLIIKEDSHTLFGFATTAERDLFRSLIGISGIGGNTALTILSGMSPADFLAAVVREDVSLLQKIKGIGAKTAARIILELRGKLTGLADAGGGDKNRAREEAVIALTQLGYSLAEIEKKIASILSGSAKDLRTEEIIRLVLKGN